MQRTCSVAVKLDEAAAGFGWPSTAPGDKREVRAADAAVTLFVAVAAGGGALGATEGKDSHPPEGPLAAVALYCLWVFDGGERGCMGAAGLQAAESCT